MTCAKQFAILLRKEARALAGPFLAILGIQAVLTAIGLRYLGIVSQWEPGNPFPPAFLYEYVDITKIVLLTLSFMVPVTAVVYSFWKEHLRGTTVLLSALPVHPGTWAAAKLAAAAGATAILLTVAGFNADLGRGLDNRMFAHMGIIDWFGLFYIHTIRWPFLFAVVAFMDNMKYGTAAFLAWTALYFRRFPVAAGTAIFVCYIVYYSWTLDWLLTRFPKVEWYQLSFFGSTWTAPQYLLIFPALLIVLSVAIGIYLHNRFSEV